MIIIELLISFLLLVVSVIEINFITISETPLKFLSLQNYFPDFAQLDWVITLFGLLLSILFWFFAYKGSRWRAKLYLEYVSRFSIGGLFIAASIFKIKDPELFAMLVAQYQFLPSFIVNLFSLTLPILELIAGVLLIVGPKTSWNARIIMFMMIVFIIALIQALARDLGITCGCFDIEGANDKKGAWVALVRDLVMIPPLIFLMFRTRQCWIWDYKTMNGSPQSGFKSTKKY